MYTTVLIVEDEMLVRIGVKNSIPWEELNMKVIADVPNGKLALEVYETEKPDLILTDIKMPVMDGMQLITKIRETDKETKIVILTCYEEFDLVHKALKFGVSDYILKLKMSVDEMKTVLKNVQEEIAREGALRLPTYNVKMDDSIITGNAIKEYLFLHKYTDTEFEELAKKLQFRISPEQLLVCVMTIDHVQCAQDEFGNGQGDFFQTSISNILYELLNEYRRGEVICDNDERYILIFSFSDITDQTIIYQDLFDILSRINEMIQLYANSSTVFGISSIRNEYSSIGAMYQECMEALEHSYFAGDGRYIRWDDIQAKRFLIGSDQFLLRYIAGLPMLNEDYHKEMEAGAKLLSQRASITRTEIQNIFLRWLNWPTIYIKSYRDKISKIALEYTNRILQCRNLEQSMKVFRQYLMELNQYFEGIQSQSRAVAEAIQFIHQKYPLDLSLQQVAEQVELNPNYLSSLFKKELKMSFVEYLNQFRIEKAKNLLLNTHLKSYEIAENVGIPDESYFSRIFKRSTGLRPNEFRRQCFIAIQKEKDIRGNPLANN